MMVVPLDELLPDEWRVPFEPASMGRSGPGRWLVRRYGHPDWCGRGHHCGLGEHRSLPIVVEIEQVGRVVMTRVLGRDDRERMEITGSAYLVRPEEAARHQLHSTLTGMVEVLRRAAVEAGTRHA